MKQRRCYRFGSTNTFFGQPFLVARQQSLFSKKISLMSLTPLFLCATSLQQELAFHSSDAPFLSLSAVSELLPLHYTKYAMAFLVRVQAELWLMGNGLADVTESCGSLLHGWRWRTGDGLALRSIFG